MVSLSWMPATLVLIALNSPRMFEGASGLGSQISMWLGPPCRKSRMTDFALPKPLARAKARCQERPSPGARRTGAASAQASPPRPRAGTRAATTRHTVLPILPGIDIIIHLRSAVLRAAFAKSRLLIEQKRIAVEQRPLQVLRPRQRDWRRPQVCLRLLNFLGARRAVERGHVEVIDDLAVGRALRSAWRCGRPDRPPRPRPPAR